jgi:hypothetical protein
MMKIAIELSDTDILVACSKDYPNLSTSVLVSKLNSYRDDQNNSLTSTTDRRNPDAHISRYVKEHR